MAENLNEAKAHLVPMIIVVNFCVHNNMAFVPVLN
jgi:hypothetical protein